MEDASTVSSPLDESLSNCHLLAVFDGHAGAGAAQHAAAHIRSQLHSHWGCATAEAALTGAFETLDKDFRCSTEPCKNQSEPNRQQLWRGSSTSSGPQHISSTYSVKHDCLCRRKSAAHQLLSAQPCMPCSCMHSPGRHPDADAGHRIQHGPISAEFRRWAVS